MKRYPAFDPPEYVNFEVSKERVASFDDTLREHADRRAIVEALEPEKLLVLYRGLVRFRLHDIMLKRWVRQGVISKAWLGTGEEAVTIGSVHALDKDDVVGPMIRNAGACHELGMPLADMFRGYLATADSLTGGRDLHIGDLTKGIVAPISHVGSLVPVCAGMALSFKLKGEARVALTYVGDGATRTGEFHEGLSLAAVQKVPLIVVIQDNQVALGTVREQHSLPGTLEGMHHAYGVAHLECDGNNVLDVYAATRLLAAKARAGEGSAILLAHTFRMGGHATHDEAEARRVFPAELFERWGARDPIGIYEAWLWARGFADDRVLEEAEEQVIAEVEAGAEEALESRRTSPPDPATVLDGVYKD